MNITIDKTLLLTILHEFWLLDNNELTHDVTLIALNKMGFTVDEIKYIIPEIGFFNFKRAKEALDEAIKETEHYYLKDDD